MIFCSAESTIKSTRNVLKSKQNKDYSINIIPKSNLFIYLYKQYDCFVIIRIRMLLTSAPATSTSHYFIDEHCVDDQRYTKSTTSGTAKTNSRNNDNDNDVNNGYNGNDNELDSGKSEYDTNGSSKFSGANSVYSAPYDATANTDTTTYTMVDFYGGGHLGRYVCAMVRYVVQSWTNC